MRSLNAFAYRATLVHLRPSFRRHKHATTDLTQGEDLPPPLIRWSVKVAMSSVWPYQNQYRDAYAALAR